MADRLLALGAGGVVTAALCCVTPVLPMVLGGLGLSGLIPILHRDAVLLPILAVFLGVLGVALWRRHRARG